VSDMIQYQKGDRAPRRRYLNISTIASVLSCSIRGYKLDREVLSWILTRATVSNSYVTSAACPLCVHPDSVAFAVEVVLHAVERLGLEVEEST